MLHDGCLHMFVLHHVFVVLQLLLSSLENRDSCPCLTDLAAVHVDMLC